MDANTELETLQEAGGAIDGAKGDTVESLPEMKMDVAAEKDKALKMQFMGEVSLRAVRCRLSVKLAAQVAGLQSQLMATEEREAKLKETVGCLGQELAALQNQLMQDSPRDQSGLVAAGQEREAKLKAKVLDLSQEVAALQNQLMGL